MGGQAGGEQGKQAGKQFQEMERVEEAQGVRRQQKRRRLRTANPK